MILRRLGNKAKIAGKIAEHFPPHKIYIEPFFGAGGMFFNKPKAKYNILNDIDSDVFNFFMVVMNQKDELIDMVKKMPIHEDLLKYWIKNNENEPVKKALRFIFLSNYVLYGKLNLLKLGALNTSEMILKNIEKTHEMLFGCQFTNVDFRVMLNKISFHRANEMNETFIYCDPPYLGTTNNYSDGFTEKDFDDLLKIMVESGCKFAISEFDNPIVIQKAKDCGLHIQVIGERRNIKNRRTEILITNYNLQPTLF